jgi:hypothetical protein
MSIIDLPPSEYRRVIKGEKPPSQWLDPRSWAVIDWVLAVCCCAVRAIDRPWRMGSRAEPRVWAWALDRWHVLAPRRLVAVDRAHLGQ